MSMKRFAVLAAVSASNHNISTIGLTEKTRNGEKDRPESIYNGNVNIVLGG